MDQDKQTGFFRQYYIACFQPRNYKTLLEKKTGHHVMYVFLLMVFLLLIDTIIPFGAWTASVGGFKNLFLNRLPEFTMENGTLHTEEPIDFTIGGIIRVQVDSSVEKFKESDFKVDYQEEILMSKTNLLMRVGKNVSEVSLNQLGGITVNNQTLVNAMPAIGAAMFMYFLFSLLSKTIQYLLMALGRGAIAGRKICDHKTIVSDCHLCKDAFCHYQQRQYLSGLCAQQFLDYDDFRDDCHKLYIQSRDFHAQAKSILKGERNYV